MLFKNFLKYKRKRKDFSEKTEPNEMLNIDQTANLKYGVFSGDPQYWNKYPSLIKNKKISSLMVPYNLPFDSDFSQFPKTVNPEFVNMFGENKINRNFNRGVLNTFKQGKKKTFENIESSAAEFEKLLKSEDSVSVNLSISQSQSMMKTAVKNEEIKIVKRDETKVDVIELDDSLAFKIDELLNLNDSKVVDDFFLAKEVSFYVKQEQAAEQKKKDFQIENIQITPLFSKPPKIERKRIERSFDIPSEKFVNYLNNPKVIIEPIVVNNSNDADSNFDLAMESVSKPDNINIIQKREELGNLRKTIAKAIEVSENVVKHPNNQYRLNRSFANFGYEHQEAIKKFNENVKKEAQIVGNKVDLQFSNINKISEAIDNNKVLINANKAKAIETALVRNQVLLEKKLAKIEQARQKYVQETMKSKKKKKKEEEIVARSYEKVLLLRNKELERYSNVIVKIQNHYKNMIDKNLENVNKEEADDFGLTGSRIGESVGNLSKSMSISISNIQSSSVPKSFLNKSFGSFNPNKAKDAVLNVNAARRIDELTSEVEIAASKCKSLNDQMILLQVELNNAKEKDLKISQLESELNSLKESKESESNEMKEKIITLENELNTLKGEEGDPETIRGKIKKYELSLFKATTENITTKKELEIALNKIKYLNEEAVKTTKKVEVLEHRKVIDENSLYLKKIQELEESLVFLTKEYKENAEKLIALEKDNEEIVNQFQSKLDSTNNEYNVLKKEYDEINSIIRKAQVDLSVLDVSSGSEENLITVLNALLLNNKNYIEKLFGENEVLKKNAELEKNNEEAKKKINEKIDENNELIIENTNKNSVLLELMKEASIVLTGWGFNVGESPYQIINSLKLLQGKIQDSFINIARVNQIDTQMLEEYKSKLLAYESILSNKTNELQMKEIQIDSKVLELQQLEMRMNKTNNNQFINENEMSQIVENDKLKIMISEKEKMINNYEKEIELLNLNALKYDEYNKKLFDENQNLLREKNSLLEKVSSYENELMNIQKQIIDQNTALLNEKRTNAVLIAEMENKSKSEISVLQNMLENMQLEFKKIMSIVKLGQVNNYYVNNISNDENVNKLNEMGELIIESQYKINQNLVSLDTDIKKIINSDVKFEFENKLVNEISEVDGIQYEALVLSSDGIARVSKMFSFLNDEFFFGNIYTTVFPIEFESKKFLLGKKCVRPLDYGEYDSSKLNDNDKKIVDFFGIYYESLTCNSATDIDLDNFAVRITKEDIIEQAIFNLTSNMSFIMNAFNSLIKLTLTVIYKCEKIIVSEKEALAKHILMLYYHEISTIMFGEIIYLKNYFFNKEENFVYKGIASMLYELFVKLFDLDTSKRSFLNELISILGCDLVNSVVVHFEIIKIYVNKIDKTDYTSFLIEVLNSLTYENKQKGKMEYYDLTTNLWFNDYDKAINLLWYKPNQKDFDNGFFERNIFKMGENSKIHRSKFVESVYERKRCFEFFRDIYMTSITSLSLYLSDFDERRVVVANKTLQKLTTSGFGGFMPDDSGTIFNSTFEILINIVASKFFEVNKHYVLDEEKPYSTLYDNLIKSIKEKVDLILPSPVELNYVFLDDWQVNVFKDVFNKINNFSNGNVLILLFFLSRFCDKLKNIIPELDVISNNISEIVSISNQDKIVDESKLLAFMFAINKYIKFPFFDYLYTAYKPKFNKEGDFVKSVNFRLENKINYSLYEETFSAFDSVGGGVLGVCIDIFIPFYRYFSHKMLSYTKNSFYYNFLSAICFYFDEFDNKKNKNMNEHFLYFYFISKSNFLKFLLLQKWENASENFSLSIAIKHFVKDICDIFDVCFSLMGGTYDNISSPAFRKNLRYIPFYNEKKNVISQVTGFGNLDTDSYVKQISDPQFHIEYFSELANLVSGVEGGDYISSLFTKYNFTDFCPMGFILCLDDSEIKNNIKTPNNNWKTQIIHQDNFFVNIETNIKNKKNKSLKFENKKYIYTITSCVFFNYNENKYLTINYDQTKNMFYARKKFEKIKVDLLGTNDMLTNCIPVMFVYRRMNQLATNKEYKLNRNLFENSFQNIYEIVNKHISKKQSKSD